MTLQLDLFAPEKPKLEPVDLGGEVIHGAPDITFRLPHPRMAWDLMQLQIHEHEDGRWMWAVTTCTGGYKVGPKWGRFADTQEAAVRFAAAEAIDKISNRTASSLGIGPEHRSAMLNFARGFLT